MLKDSENNILKLITEESSFLNPQKIELLNQKAGFCCFKKREEKIKNEVIQRAFIDLLPKYFQKNVQFFLSDWHIENCLEGILLREIKASENGNIVLGEEVDRHRIFEFLQMFFSKSLVPRLKEWVIQGNFFRNNLLWKIENEFNTIDGPEIKRDPLKPFKAILQSLKITISRGKSSSIVIFFSSLNQTNFPLLSFVLGNFSLFSDYGLGYLGIKDKCFKGDQRASCFFLEKYYPEFWGQTLKNSLGIAYGFSMGGHPALKYGLLYRRPCFLINPASSVSIFQEIHHAGKDFTFLPSDDLETQPYWGDFHPVYWIFSKESSFDVKILESELLATHLNTLYFFHPFGCKDHVEIKAKKPEELILLLHKLNNVSAQGDQDVLGGAQNVVIFHDLEKHLLKQVQLAITGRKKIILKNTTIDPEVLKMKGFSIAYIFDQELKPGDIENIKKGACLLLKEKEISQKGLSFCQRALLNIDYLDIEKKLPPPLSYFL